MYVFQLDIVTCFIGVSVEYDDGNKDIQLVLWLQGEYDVCPCMSAWVVKG